MLKKKETCFESSLMLRGCETIKKKHEARTHGITSIERESETENVLLPANWGHCNVKCVFYNTRARRNETLRLLCDVV